MLKTEEDSSCFTEDPGHNYEQADINFFASYFSNTLDINKIEENARKLLMLSPGAFDTLLHAWLSELPIIRETAAFGRKVLAGGDPQDRGDPDTLAVLNTSAKVYHEIHRMMGLLRFSPDERGEYIALCAPDHFILPALGDYFKLRFGETAWSIIDEKRGLRMREGVISKPEKIDKAPDDEWTELWKHYHKTINNKDRKNPGLQRQFMPERYWKYLPEELFKN